MIVTYFAPCPALQPLSLVSIKKRSCQDQRSCPYGRLLAPTVPHTPEGEDEEADERHQQHDGEHQHQDRLPVVAIVPVVVERREDREDPADEVDDRTNDLQACASTHMYLSPSWVDQDQSIIQYY